VQLCSRCPCTARSCTTAAEWRLPPARSKTTRRCRIERRSYGRRRRGLPLRSRWPNGGRNLSRRRSSGWMGGYHAVGPLEAHDVDGVGSDEEEEDAHGVEVERPPVVLQDHVRVARHEHHHVQLLRSVGQPDHVLVRQDLQQQHQHRDQVQEVPDQLEHVHNQLIIHVSLPQTTQS
jgi:hypothetical protein